MTQTLTAVYADGWDGAIVNPMTAAEAKARDAAGEPYAVLLLANGRLDTELRLSWRDGYCGITRCDPLGRRVSTHELRRTGDGDLFLRQWRTWDGPDDVSEHEFPHVAARHRTTYQLDGRRLDVDEPHGDRGGSRHSQGFDSPPRLPVPEFGRWHGLLELAGLGRPELVDAVSHDLPVASADEPPWQPPRPWEPEGLPELFVAGSEHPVGDQRWRVGVHPAGELRMPSGRLVAADPSSLDFDAEPFTVTVAPGTYPVSISVAHDVAEPDHRRVAAARLDITDRQVIRWELALRDGQDLLDLGHRQFFGFGVDAGLACFVDADECGRITEVWREFDGLVETRFRVVETGVMVAWSSGWGDGAYPTWIGRDADGEVVCFLADMLLFGPDDEDQDEDE